MKWPKGWRSVDDRLERATLEAQLYREISKSHVLYDHVVTLIGRSEGQDDFLFQLQDGRVAAVHLTWAIEPDPAWPAAQLHHSLDAWSLAQEVAGAHVSLDEARPPVLGQVAFRDRLLKLVGEVIKFALGMAVLAYFFWAYLHR